MQNKRCYLIDYESSSVEYNYDVVSQITNLGDWQHPMESVWFVCTDLAKDTILNNITSKFKNKEREHVFIIPLIPDEYKGWMPKFLWKWLRDKMK